MMGLYDSLAARYDRFVNMFSGVGTSRDRTTGGIWCASPPINDNTLTALWSGNWLAAKVVGIVPDECQREGYQLPQAPQLAAAAKMLNLDGHVHLAHTWGRLYGGAVLYAVTDDREPSDTPLQPGARVVDLQVWDKRRIYIQRYHTDPRLPSFGQPAIYSIQPVVGMSAQPPEYVHSTRLVHFGGALTDEQTKLAFNGWDYSVLQRVLEDLTNFAESTGAVNAMLSNANQGVFKMHGLLDAVTSKKTADLQARMAMLDMMASNIRSIMLDADPKFGEDYSKVPSQFAGIADTIRTCMQIVAAASGIPTSILFGQMPGGLSASADTEENAFYARMRTHQRIHLEPKIRKVLAMIDPIGATTPMFWPSLEIQSAKDAAAMRLAQAQADVAYEAPGILSAADIQRSRFPDTGWSPETHVTTAPVHPALAQHSTPLPSRAARPENTHAGGATVPGGPTRVATPSPGGAVVGGRAKPPPSGTDGST